MKNTFFTYLILLSAIVSIAGCNRPSPDEFFQTTILNTNILSEFASERFTRELVSNTVVYPDIPASTKNGDEAQQIVQVKSAYLAQTIQRISEATPPDEDGERIKERALDLYQFALPVYQHEYLELAKRCDQGAPEAEIKAASDRIIETYAPSFEEKYMTLIELGEAYAKKHNINASFGQ